MRVSLLTRLRRKVESVRGQEDGKNATHPLESVMTSTFLQIRYRPGWTIAGEFTGEGNFGHTKAALGMSDQDAARYYLSELFRHDERNEIRALAGETRNRRVPSFRLVSVREQPQLNTRIVKFVETKNSIPIFGSNIVVELGQNQELVSINGQLTHVDDVNSVATISDGDALKSLKEFTRSTDWGVNPPEKQFYLDNMHKWHLVYLFHEVPAAPYDSKDASESAQGRHPLPGRAPSYFAPRFNYLVDAHDGSVVDYYPSEPANAEAAAHF